MANDVLTQHSEPVWRVKTRPCQFYLQGRCIFGEDTCNFLHTHPPVIHDHHSIPTTSNTRQSTGHPSDQQQHDCNVLKNDVLSELRQRNNSRNGPQRSSSPLSSTEQISSPSRSPRRASLLLALKDIIGDDEAGELEDEGEEGIQGSSTSTAATVLPPPIGISLTTASHSPVVSLDHVEEDDTMNPLDLKRLSHTSQLSSLSALSCSLGLSQFPIPPSYHTFSNEDEEEGSVLNDSGFYDTTKPWKSPAPLPLSPPPRTPPRSSIGQLHLPFGTPSSRLNTMSGSGLMSPRLVSPTSGAFVPRSPFRTPAPNSDPDIHTVGQMEGYGTEFELNREHNTSLEPLDSPTVYHRKRELEERRTLKEEKGLPRKRDEGRGSGTPSSVRDWSMDILQRPSSSSQRLSVQTHELETGRQMEEDDASTPRSVFEDDDDDDYIVDVEEELKVEEDDSIEHEEPGSSGHTSLWDDSRNQDTVVFLGRHTKVQSTLRFVEEEMQGCSSFADDHDDDDLDETARLPYVDRENDTLNSLYDVYSDIGSEVGDGPQADPDRPYTPAGFPLPSPTHSEVHSHALLALFNQNKEEGRRISPADAYAYEPDDSFRSSSGIAKDGFAKLADLNNPDDSSEERVLSPVCFPFLRERVFTPPPPPTPPAPLKEKEIPPLPSTSQSQRQLHRTPPQSSLAGARPRTPRSAPAATAVYEKDRRRTSTMVDPDTPPKVPAAHRAQRQEAEDESDISSEDLEDLDRIDDETSEIHKSEEGEQKEKSESEVLRRGLKPLRLSTLFLSDKTNVESPILTASGSVFGYADGAGSHRSSYSRLEPGAHIVSILAHTDSAHSTHGNANDISRLSPSNGLLPSTNAHHVSSVTSPASTSASSSIAFLDTQSLSVSNTLLSLSSSLSSSPAQPPQLPLSQQPSSLTSRPSPPSLPSSRSNSRPVSLSAGTVQRRQSRIHYIKHVDPNSDLPVPRTSPLVPTDPTWNAAAAASRLLPSPVSNLSDEENSLNISTSNPEAQAKASHLRRTAQEDNVTYPRHPTAPPPPIRIPTPSQGSSPSQSPSVSSQSLGVRSKSSRTSPLVEQQQYQQLTPATASSVKRPTLLFAIASDDPVEVQKVLEEASVSGSAPATQRTLTGDYGSKAISPPLPSSATSPTVTDLVTANDAVGPQSQSALEFVLTNDGLKNKLDIVKVLLGYGADPVMAGFKGTESGFSGDRVEVGNSDGADVDAKSVKKARVKSKEDGLDEATRYYLSRATSTITRKTAALLQRSVFQPLQRMRYEIIGQDRALEQLFRVLSVHQSTRTSGSKTGHGHRQPPLVVFLCGPSGHGKSLLAHQFGSLLDVPIHTVNMTTLRSADDLWNSYSIASSEDVVPCPLVEFLANNEGKRCIVVLDEIEKTEDTKVLWSLLVPWELGRCTFEANSRTIDVRNVIWVCTSNIGQDIIFSFHESRAQPNDIFSREEYVELMGILRPRVSDRLGTSVLSRVSAILPFVPFTEREKKAIAVEFLMQRMREVEVMRELVASSTKEDPEVEIRWRERIVKGAMNDYILSEGARSLYRAVSNHLVDSLDEL